MQTTLYQTILVHKVSVTKRFYCTYNMYVCMYISVYTDTIYTYVLYVLCLQLTCCIMYMYTHVMRTVYMSLQCLPLQSLQSRLSKLNLSYDEVTVTLEERTSKVSEVSFSPSYLRLLCCTVLHCVAMCTA